MLERHNLTDEVSYIEPDKACFFVDEFEDLTLELAGEKTYTGVRVKRAFPLSHDDCFIVVQDSKGDEIGSLARLDQLDRTSRQVVAQELERAYFTPRIQRITKVTVRFRVPRWEVETDRGPRAFEIYSSRRDVRHLGGGRVLVQDADGNRYEIPDYRQMEPASRALVEEMV
ncbi:MAG: DUF1854 domain-containing protein [Candidatus Latescibacteria bacterium]|nr:DUF1854 domain-containing protein [Candidatus Latescibacterota bacterium]